MGQGRLIQVDPPRQIYEWPCNRYVAGFIGEINLIEGGIEIDETGLARLHWAEGEPSLLLHAGRDGRSPSNGTRAWLAVRPEKVEIGKQPPAAAEGLNVVEGVVKDIGYIGNLTTFHVRLADGHMVKAQDANSRQAQDRGISWEDTVWLSWQAVDAVLLED